MLLFKGQLGVDKIIKYQNKPEPIPGQFLPRPVVQIACSETTSAAVTGEVLSNQAFNNVHFNLSIL